MTSASSAVLLREALRGARRWQTHGLRAAFSAALLAAVLLTVGEQGARVDPATAANRGRELFGWYVGVQATLVFLLAPLLVGAGIAEEREDDTLELLAITPLTAGQILGGKVASRLLVLLTAVLGGTPVLALVTSFGGVGVWEVVNVTSATLLMAVVLGAIGGFVGLFARAPLATVLAAVGYAFVAFGILPMVHDALSPFSGGMWVSPMYGLFDDTPGSLLAWVAFLPALALVARLGTSVFRIVVGAGGISDDVALVSAEVWAFDRLVREAQGAALVGAVLTAAVVTWSQVAPTPSWAVWGWFAVVLYAATGLYLLALLGVARARERVRSTRARVVQSGLPRGGARLRQVVRGNPVTWREVVTGAHGASASLGRWVLFGWLALGLLLWALYGDSDPNPFLGTLAILAGLLFTVLSATASGVGERRAGVLPILLLTPLSTARIVLGKLGAVAVNGGPLYALGVLLTVGTIWADQPRRLHEELAYVCSEGPARVAGLSFALTLAWAAAFWSTLSLTALGIALRVRPARLAWGANLVVGLLVIGWPFPVALFVRRPWMEVVGTTWLPFLSNDWGIPGCQPAASLWQGALLQLGLSVGLVALLARRLRAWGTR